MGQVTARDAARVQAAFEGAHARADGLSAQTCPYEVDSQDDVERFLAAAWLKGWQRAHH